MENLSLGNNIIEPNTGFNAYLNELVKTFYSGPQKNTTEKNTEYVPNIPLKVQTKLRRMLPRSDCEHVMQEITDHLNFNK